MMSDIYILNKMIKDNAKIFPKTDKRGLEVKLIEPQYPDSSAIIFDLPINAIIIKVGRFKIQDTVLNCSIGRCKCSDFAIIADTGNKKVIIHIEIKAKKGGSKKDVINQLKGSDCVVAYCRKIGQNFCGKQDFLKDYEPRFVVITHTILPKTKTRQERKNYVHDSPDKMLVIDSSNVLSFNHLAGK